MQARAQQREEAAARRASGAQAGAQAWEAKVQAVSDEWALLELLERQHEEEELQLESLLPARCGEIAICFHLPRPPPISHDLPARYGEPGSGALPHPFSLQVRLP